jgi:hypothetical protein
LWPRLFSGPGPYLTKPSVQKSGEFLSSLQECYRVMRERLLAGILACVHVSQIGVHRNPRLVNILGSNTRR